MAFYRSIKASSQGPRSAVRPPPSRVQRCLNVLYATVFVSLILTFPYFSPPNHFRETNSRLGLPTNLLASRLTALRQGNLSHLDELFIDKLEHEPEKVRLLYAAYGPDVVLECPFCKATEPQSYLYYALPAILTPHVFHIGLLGVITSSFFSGPEGARWRTYATIAGVALALGELYMTWTYKWEGNGSKRMLQDVDFFYLKMRLWRQLAFAAVDSILGWVLWLTSTNRWLVKPPALTEQLAEVSQTLQKTYTQINLLGNLRNAIVRDNQLRTTNAEYWLREQREMEEIEREREVVDAKNIALSRMDYDKVQQRAENYVDQVFSGLRPTPGPPQAKKNV